MIKNKYILALFTISIVFFTLLMGGITAPYISLKTDVDFLLTKQHLLAHSFWLQAFYVHIFSSSFVLLAGVTQFNPWILKYYPKIHRLMGYVYIGGILLISGPGGFIMGFYANGGYPVISSFVLLTSIWMITTAWAFLAALKKDWRLHRHMIWRSYALTLSAITLRLYVKFSPLLILMPGKDLYITVSWLSWVPNILIVEWLIYRELIKLSKYSQHIIK